MTVIQRSSMLQYLTSMFFIFSTLYGLAFFYYEGKNQSFSYEGLQDREDTNAVLDSERDSGWISTILSSTFNSIVEALSLFSPFILVKGLLYLLLHNDAPKMYDVLNIFLLRPVGWVGTWITTEWVINKLRGTSE